MAARKSTAAHAQVPKAAARKRRHTQARRPTVPTGAAVVGRILEMSAENRLRVAAAASADFLASLTGHFLSGSEIDVPRPKLLPQLIRARFAVDWAEDGTRCGDETTASFAVKHFPETIPNLWRMLHLVQADLVGLLTLLTVETRYRGEAALADLRRYQLAVILLPRTFAGDEDNVREVVHAMTGTERPATREEALQEFVDFHTRGAHLTALWGR